MKVAVAVDFTEVSEAALGWAVQFCGVLQERKRPCELMAIHITRSASVLTGQVVQEDVEGVRGRVGEMLMESGAGRATRMVVGEGEPAGQLAEFCRQEEVDYLVIGRGDRSWLARMLDGSTARRLVEEIEVPLVIVDTGAAGVSRESTIAVGVDFSPSAEGALFEAAKLAEAVGAELHVLHVLQDLPMGSMTTGLVNYLSSEDLAKLSGEARRSLEAVMEELQERFSELKYATRVQTGNPVEVLAGYVRRSEPALLVLGKAHRSRVMEWILGGVGKELMKEMPTTLLLVPSGKGGK